MQIIIRPRVPAHCIFHIRRARKSKVRIPHPLVAIGTPPVVLGPPRFFLNAEVEFWDARARGKRGPAGLAPAYP